MRRASALLLATLLLGASCRDGGAQQGTGPRRAPLETTTTLAGDTTTTSTTSADDPAPSSTSARPATTSTTRQGGTAVPGTSGSTGTATNSSSTSTSTTTSRPTTTVTTVRPVALTDVRVRLTRIATLDQPLALALRAGDDAFYVAEKRGRVRALRGGQVSGEPVLDLSGDVTVGGEQGLLGIAFSPDGSLFYASFTDRGGDSRLWEYTFRDGRADVSTKRELIFQKQPFGNHNGGQVTFGPDGLLYYFLGDGGSGGDPMGNAQNLNTLLGKVLRIDPSPSGDLPYTIPADNPFVGRADARGEVFAYGLRNPWRNSFDRLTGDLWLGDVGQSAIEEIDWVSGDAARGANFGWSAYEGSKRFKPAVPANGHIPPVHEYPTRDGCAVTGGYVYRGAAIPAMAGAYLFGDFCNGIIQALRLVDGRVVEHRSLGLEVPQLASFGEGPDGELYTLSLGGGLFRIEQA